MDKGRDSRKEIKVRSGYGDPRKKLKRKIIK